MNHLDIIDLLSLNKPFLFARYNDGELIAITNWDFIFNCPADKSIGNIDGHLYFREMGETLKYAIECDENVELSIKNKYIFSTKIANYIKRNTESSLLHTIKFNVNTINNEIADYIYTEPQKFMNFLEIINSKNTILIGPKYLEMFQPLKIKHHIIIPLLNCFLVKERIMEEIIQQMNNHTECIFIFSASMTTNYIIEKMKYKALDKHTMIDIGSAFDNFISKDRLSEINRRIYVPDYIKNNYPVNYWIE